MNWTTTPPTVPGWYWARSKYDVKTDCVKVDEWSRLFPLCAWVVGWDSYVDLDDFTHWLGPIDVPKPPEAP